MAFHVWQKALGCTTFQPHWKAFFNPKAPLLAQKNDALRLTGHYSSANLGESDLTGTVKGAEINFSFDAELQGQAMSVTYAGTVDGDSMSGTVDLGGLASGTFTGERQ